MSCLKSRNSSSLDIESSTGVGIVHLLVQGLFVGSFYFFNLAANARLYHQSEYELYLGQLPF